MDALWAPWRMAYLQPQHQKEDDRCIFCLKDLSEQDEERLVLCRESEALLMMNLYPYSNGHLLVVPHQHTADPASLSVETVLQMHHLQLKGMEALRSLMNPEGFNVGMNLGKVAGAGVAEHLHLHIVPRWHGDTNFMPVLADVRVIPEHLHQTYTRLRDLLR